MMSRCGTQAPIILGVRETYPADLERRIRAMEEAVEKSLASTTPWSGVFKNGCKALPGQFWTHGGSLWHCDGPTTKSPAQDPEAWTLAVKRGKAGE